MLYERILDMISNINDELLDALNRKDIERCKLCYLRLNDLGNVLNELFELFYNGDDKEIIYDLDRHIYFIGYYLEKEDYKWMERNANDIKERDISALYNLNIQSNEYLIYKSLNLHPIIKEASESLFRAEYYSEAVMKACIALENYVKINRV